jgi:hypothetical protein
VRACVERVRWVAWDGSGAGLDRCVQGFEHGIRTGSDQCIGHLLLLFFFLSKQRGQSVQDWSKVEI